MLNNKHVSLLYNSVLKAAERKGVDFDGGIMNFIFKRFIKDYKNYDDAGVRSQYGKISGIIGVVLNMLLFTAKLIAGIISGSLALMTDAVNNLTDSTSSAVTFVGFHLSEKPADDEHPYGHARIEYLTGVFVSFFILFLGLQMALSSVGRIFEPEETKYNLLVILIMVASVLMKLWLYLSYKSTGKKIASETLLATAGDSLNDAIATTVILIGAGISILFDINIDGYLSFAVAVFIIVSGIQLIIETANPLLGTAPDAKLVKLIWDEINAYDGIIGMHDLQIHNYGAGRCFATVHCEVPAEQDVMISHDIVDNIERDFMERLNINLVIHMDPIETDNKKTDQLNMEIQEKISEKYPEVTVHDFRVVWGITHSNVVFDISVPFTLKVKDEELKREIKGMLTAIDPSYIGKITVDRTSMVNMMYMD